MDLTGLSTEDLAEIVNTQAAYIEQLEEQLHKGQAKKNNAEPSIKPHIPEPVEVDGKIYKFRFASFRFKGSSYRADHAQYDDALIQQILSIPGQTILKQIK